MVVKEEKEVKYFIRLFFYLKVVVLCQRLFKVLRYQDKIKDNIFVFEEFSLWERELGK